MIRATCIERERERERRLGSDTLAGGTVTGGILTGESRCAGGRGGEGPAEGVSDPEVAALSSAASERGRD